MNSSSDDENTIKGENRERRNCWDLVLAVRIQQYGQAALVPAVYIDTLNEKDNLGE